MEDNQIYKHNEDLTYLLQRKLSFMLQYGMSFLVILGLIVLLALYFIKAPDTLEGRFTLSSNNPPKSFVAKVSSRISQKKIEDKSFVKRGDILLILESVGSAEEILQLEQFLMHSDTSMMQNGSDSIMYIEINDFNHLGEIQQSFEQFKKSNNELFSVLTNGQYKMEKQIIEKRLKNLIKSRINISSQQGIYERDFELALEGWKVDSILVAQRGISKAEFRNAESSKLMKKLGLTNVQQSIINNETSINDIEQQLLNLEKGIIQQKNSFFQNYAILKTAIEDWKSKYLVTATFDGTISFNRNIYIGLQVNTGDPLVYLIPEGSNWVAELLIPQQNFGKLERNQRAILKFDGYSFEEFGIVEGIVNNISNIPQEVKSTEGAQNLFLIQIGLDSNIQTSYHKIIEPRFGLSGVCTITLDNKSILEKLFLDKLKALFVYN